MNTQEIKNLPRGGSSSSSSAGGKVTPKDFFLWVAAMVALYVSAVSLIALWFEYIEVLFPDPLEYYRDPFSGAIRFAIASLIVIFPLYVFFTRLLNQDIRRNPDKKRLWIRRWLIYLTLFAAGITVSVDIIALINAFLGGDLSVRFTLKVLAVLIVIGSGFGYYFYDLKEKWERDARLSKSIGWVVSLVILVSIISGFFIIGSPFTQRYLRFDQEKVNHLQSIQWQIVDYWRQKEALPDQLSDLEYPITGFIVPTDPQTGEEYAYRVKDALTFELCAVFNRASTDTAGVVPIARPVAFERSVGIGNENWAHEAGEECFERTIDPELSLPLEKIR